MASSHANGAASASTASVAKRIPKGTWDTHMHVVDPGLFPLSKDAQYQPKAHTLEQAQAFLTGHLGIERMVIVQPSIYGNDNACTLDGLRRLGVEKGRAIVQFDPDQITEQELKQWYALGVRGVRLNFKSVNRKVEQEELRTELLKHATAVTHLDNWILELYIPMESIPLLEPIVASLPSNIKLCIDHFGHPAPSSLSTCKSGHEVPGFDSLLRLLRQGQTWVKLSAGYRLSREDPRHPLVESLCKEILKCRADRCVFATDWPHTRFEGLEVEPYLEAVLDWVEEEGVEVRKVLVENAEVLFGGE